MKTCTRHTICTRLSGIHLQSPRPTLSARCRGIYNNDYKLRPASLESELKAGKEGHRDPALGEAHVRSSKSESSTSTRACARTSQALPVVSLCAYRDLFTFMLKFFGKNDSIIESCCMLDRASGSRRVKRFTGNRLQPRRLSK